MLGRGFSVSDQIRSVNTEQCEQKFFVQELFPLPVSSYRMRRLLELFCGTKSVSKAIGHEFDEVISLDLDAAHEPTIRADILQWDYTVYPPG